MEKHLSCTTLNGTTAFDYIIENHKLYLRFGRRKINSASFEEVDCMLICKVFTRILELAPKSRRVSSNYQQGRWAECINAETRFAPYIAALILNTNSLKRFI